MALATTLARYQYTASGSVASFSFPAVFINPGDILVTLLDQDGTQKSTTLNGTGTYDYTVSGTQDAASGEYLSGASIVFNTIPPSGWLLTLFRDPPATQTLALVAGGKFPAEAVNTALDRLTMMVQALLDSAVRALTAPSSEPLPPTGPSLVVPSVAARAGRVLGFDSLGRPAAGGDLGVLESLTASQMPSLAGISWVGTIAGLRALAAPTTGTLVLVAGYYAEGDKAPVLYRYAGSSAVTDDGGYAIKPTAVSGNGRWLLSIQGRALDVQDWGADPTGVLAADAAFTAWFAAVLAHGGDAEMPSGTYTFASQAYWNLTSVAATGVRIRGAVGNTVLDFTAVAASPALLIGGTTDLYGVELRGFQVKGNFAGIVVQFGHEDFSDPFHDPVIDIQVDNLSTSASAVGTEINYVRDARAFSAVSNCAGHGDALRLNQAQSCTFLGSFGNADIGVHFAGQSNHANVFLSPDVAAVGVCVQIDGTSDTNGDNVFIGGKYAWTGASMVVANHGASYTRFIAPHPGAGTLVTGAKAGNVLIEDAFIGVSPFGGVQVKPPSGNGNVQVDSIDGATANIVYRHAGAARWRVGRDGTAEAGANAGSGYYIEAFDDAGNSLGNAVLIDRATLAVNILNVLAVAGGAKIGVFGATPITQPGPVNSWVATANGGAGVAAFADTTYAGAIGATAYTVGDLVSCFKRLGFIAS